jgi:hypothetical protein
MNGVQNKEISLNYSCLQVHTTLQGKFRLCIPRKGIARPQSQFPHSCICERFIYSHERSTFFVVLHEAISNDIFPSGIIRMSLWGGGGG